MTGNEFKHLSSRKTARHDNLTEKRSIPFHGISQKKVAAQLLPKKSSLDSQCTNLFGSWSWPTSGCTEHQLARLLVTNKQVLMACLHHF